MKKFRILDLFCGAGGAGVGYARAGFEVVGVDIEIQKNYPFPYYREDAFEFPWDGFDAIHASPPCQRYSQMTRRSYGAWEKCPDTVPPTQERLRASGLPYVIENVVNAPLDKPMMLCASSFGLPMWRHRLFELGGFRAPALPCRHELAPNPIQVVGKPGGVSKRDGRLATAAEWQEAMGIDWMTTREIVHSVPPVYTEHIGKFLYAHLERVAGIEPA